MLFDVQWWPEKFLSQSFNGMDNSAQTVITTTKTIVNIDAHADETTNLGLFINILFYYTPTSGGRNRKSHRTDKKSEYCNRTDKPQNNITDF